MKHKPVKGTQGYLELQRKRSLIRTIVYFAISLAVYLIGYLTTKSNQNYLTIAAVLGCLPASKSAVNTIMFYRYHGCSSKNSKQIQPHTEDLSTLWDLVFTSYEKNFEIHHMALRDNTLIGFTTHPKCDFAACEKHLRTLLAQNGFKVTVKIFSDISKYTTRLDQLAALSVNTENASATSEKEEQILGVLRAISL